MKRVSQGCPEGDKGGDSGLQARVFCAKVTKVLKVLRVTILDKPVSRTFLYLRDIPDRQASRGTALP